MDDLRRGYLEQIRRGGVTLTPELAAAFAGVPREAFVPDGFRRRHDGGWVRPGDDDFLPILHAILFAIHDCGFVARIAVEDIGSNETRLDKIARIIREPSEVLRREAGPSAPIFDTAIVERLQMGPRPKDFYGWRALPSTPRNSRARARCWRRSRMRRPSGWRC